MVLRSTKRIVLKPLYGEDSYSFNCFTSTVYWDG